MRVLLMIGIGLMSFCGDACAMKAPYNQAESDQWIEALMQPKNERWHYTDKEVFLCEKEGRQVKRAATWQDIGLILNMYINDVSVMSSNAGRNGQKERADSKEAHDVVARFAAFRTNAPEGVSSEYHAEYIKALEYIAERGLPGKISQFIKNEEQLAEKVESPSLRERRLTKRSSLHKLLSLVHHTPKESAKKEK